MTTTDAYDTALEVAKTVSDFEAEFGRQSFVLAAHAAVAHRLRPEIVALIRTNFLPNPEKFEAHHDAAVLFGPLCRSEGDDFFEIRADIKDFLVDVLDRIMPLSSQGRLRSQDVARMLRHYFKSVEADPLYECRRYDQFRQENLWRLIAIDDPKAARGHIRDHAKRRDAVARDELATAPRGAGIVSVAGSRLGRFHEDLAYLEAQDMIADGNVEDGVALLQILVATGADLYAEPLLAPSKLLGEQRAFLERRENMVSDGDYVNDGSPETSINRMGKTLTNDLTVNARGLGLKDTPLTRALLAGDESSVEQALASRQPDLNRLDRYGLTALHHAVRLGYPDIALRLLEAGADINVNSAFNAKPIFFMGEHGLVDLAREFLARGAELCHTTAKLSTPLMAASHFGHVDLVELYLSRPEADTEHVNQKNEGGYTALTGALGSGNIVMYDMLVAAGAKPAEPMDQGYTHLHAAAAGRSVELVKRILRTGYKVDPLTLDGWSPLHIACSNTPSLDVVKLLIECGADPYRATVHGWTPIRLAACWGNLEILQSLAAAGAPLTRQHLDDAANHGGTAVLKELLTNGSYPTDIAPSLVDKIVASGKRDAVAFMLERADLFNADADATLAKAVRLGKDEIVRLYHDTGRSLPALVEVKPVRETDKPRTTDPLLDAIKAASQNWRKTMTALLDWPEAREAARDAIFIASVEKGKASMLRLFQDRGWDPPDLSAPGSADDKSGKVRSWLDMLKKAESGWRDTAEALLHWPDIRATHGSEIFESAISKGHIEFFDIFEEAGWPIPDKPDDSPGWAWSVGESVANRDKAIVEILNRPGATFESDDGALLITLAAEKGLTETLAALLERTDDIDKTDNNNRTALFAAIAGGQTAATRMLLDAKADLNAIAGLHHPPVYFAAEPDHVHQLLSYGADLRRTSIIGQSYLHALIAKFEKPKAVQMLELALEAGVEIDGADVAGLTPLHLAAELGATAAVAPLLEAGADPEARTSSGATPLLLALVRGKSAMVELLLSRGADPRARLPSGLGLLHLAATRDMTEVLSKFWDDLDGANCVALGPPSRTVLQAAAEANAKGAVTAILAKGVNPNGAAGSTPPPLLLAIEAQAFEVAEELLKARASKYLRDPLTGASPLIALSRLHTANSEIQEAPCEVFVRLYRSLHPSGESPSKIAGINPTPAKPTQPAPRAPAPNAAKRSSVQDASLPPLAATTGQASPIRSSGTFLEAVSSDDPVGWHLATGSKPGLLTRALGDTGGDYGHLPVTEFAERSLSFYPGASLARLRKRQWQNPARAIFFLLIPGNTLWLNGGVQPIAEVNAKLPIRIDKTNALDYLRFHGFFARDDGMTYFCETEDDPNLQSIRKTESAFTARPIQMLEANGDAIRCSAVILKNDQLATASFTIHPDGRVDQVIEKTIIERVRTPLDLPIL